MTNHKEPTLDMVKAAIQALIDHSVFPSHAVGPDYLRTWEGMTAAVRAALAAAPWCEHGVDDGEYCRPCNLEYKRAADTAYPGD